MIAFIRYRYKKKKIKIAIYYPFNYEINVLRLLENNYIKNRSVLLPIVERNNEMNFFPWKKNEVLLVNKFGLLEPIKFISKIPDIILIPALAFDENKYRLGYGKGFYDRYLNKYLKKFKAK